MTRNYLIDALNKVCGQVTKRGMRPRSISVTAKMPAVPTVRDAADSDDSSDSSGDDGGDGDGEPPRSFEFRVEVQYWSDEFPGSSAFELLKQELLKVPIAVAVGLGIAALIKLLIA